jgi:hypothetical protein
MPRSATILAALSLLLLICARGQESTPPSSPAMGVVSGVLITHEGKPAAQYMVDVVGASPTSTYRKRVQTNKDGIFTVEDLKYGDYVIAPYLDEVNSRYPGGTSSFYNPSPVRIRLTEAESNKQITLHLGPPNRILSGTVTSSSDGSPVTATITIEFQGDPDRFIRFSSGRDGVYRVLIPAQTKLVVKITAPGYVAYSQLLAPVAEDNDPQVDIKLKPNGHL